MHFALSLGCISSPRIRIYQPESLDEDLQQAAIEYLLINAPKTRLQMGSAVRDSERDEDKDRDRDKDRDKDRDRDRDRDTDRDRNC